jgi:hypothetical protein
LTSDDKKKEIAVKAPSKSVISPEKKTEKAVKKAFEIERYNVLQVPRKISKYIGVLTVSLGVFLFGLLAYAGLTSQGNWIFLSYASSLPIVTMWIVVGLVSTVAGFLLIGSK